ncbi:hypothetical protein PVK06_037915 [Gossypium arboreum]|uniref:Uncharacterized protein n=1 Tax=Gossypium arboreum TaxID=29729 RepID=A0ABR0MZ49_GOSAR|nr:hypothetical protein PVK06_037915 [Gossypium arboreum]
MELLELASRMLLRGVFSRINMGIGFLDLIDGCANVRFLKPSSRSRQYDRVLIRTNNFNVIQEIHEAFSKTSH